MMSIHRVSSGSGYEYYTREVAAADERLERDQKLGDYYLESGAPPGQWTGSGCAHFKLTGEVTNAQMRDLFGEGKRPDAQQIRDAKGGIVDEDTLFLGQKMGAHSQANTRFCERINEHIEHFIAREGRPPTGAEKQQIRFMIGRGEFTREKMRAPLNNEELSRYIAARLRPNGGSVAGFDCTFSAPKSVSIMWALGDADVRTAVEEAHLEAINTALSFMEADVFSSRAGKNGVRRVSIDGVMAARFRHYDSRAGDPQLHDHLVIANRVFCPNDTGSGTWRTLDSRALYKAVVASSEHYNDALMVALHKRLGVRFEARGGQGNSATKMEIEGVDDELIDTFSTRRISIQRRLDELVAAYHNDHGRAPSKKTRMQLAQQATLETRSKKQHVSLPERMRTWRTQTTTRYKIEDFAPTTPESTQPTPIDLPALTKATLSGLEQRRSTWTTRHIQAEAARQIALATSGTAGTPQTIAAVTRAVINHPTTVRLAMPAPALSPRLTDSEGISLYERPDTWAYTSATMVDIEADLLDATERDTPPPATRTSIERVTAGLERAGTSLSDDQRRMVNYLALTPKAVASAVGPAGTGKTTAMKALSDAVRADGHTIVALAPSAVAARALATSLNVPASTAHQWIRRRGWEQLRPADTLIIDEAAMMDAHTLHTVVTHAINAGANVRMIGDPHQLGAVEASGAFRLIHEATGGAELDTVWRFADPNEAAASLILRSSEHGVDPFAWYVDHGRIKGGTDEEITAEAFAAWQRDQDAGLDSILISSSNERVARLNDMAQAWRKNNGELFEDPTHVTTRDGHTIYLGERILARANNPHLRYGTSFVTNGDLFTVTAIHTDGSLDVNTDTGHALTLPARYVTDHIQLGYAATIHRAQGITVDTTHALMDATTSREGAYVALTRGKTSNHAWIVTDSDAQSVPEVLTVIASHQETNTSAHQASAAEEARHLDPLTQRDIYMDVYDTANNERWRKRLTEGTANNTLPALLADAPSSPAWKALVTRLTQAEHAGINAEALINHLMAHVQEARDPAALLTWKIGHYLDADGLATLERARANAYYYGGLSDQDLAAKIEDATKRAHDLAIQAGIIRKYGPITIDGVEHPGWREREYGALTNEELHRQIAHTYMAENHADAIDDPMAYAERHKLRALTNELHLREAMSPHDWGVENYQRTHLNETTANQPNEFVEMRWESARLLRDGLKAEQLRRHLTATTPDIGDGLTHWIAPSAALADPATPQDLRDALTRQRVLLARAVDARGQQAQHEAWTTSKPADISHEEWVRDIGQAAAWRDAHKATPTTPTTEIKDTATAEKEIRTILTHTSTTQPHPTTPARDTQTQQRLQAARQRLNAHRTPKPQPQDDKHNPDPTQQRRRTHRFH